MRVHGCNVLTLTDVAEPNVLERASSLAVNSFQLVFANDHIAQGRAVLKDEDRAVTASVCVSVAGPAAVVLLVSHVLRA